MLEATGELSNSSSLAVSGGRGPRNRLAVANGRTRIPVRASLGLACYDGNTDASQLMERADRAMYADKNKGGRAARMVING